jgi:hypothetical protein
MEEGLFSAVPNTMGIGVAYSIMYGKLGTKRNGDVTTYSRAERASRILNWLAWIRASSIAIVDGNSKRLNIWRVVFQNESGRGAWKMVVAKECGTGYNKSGRCKTIRVEFEDEVNRSLVKLRLRG